MSTNSSSKKVKTGDVEDESAIISRIRDYLEACPSHVVSDSNHPALQAALDGLHKYQRQYQRNVKLQSKFSQPSESQSQAMEDEDDVVTVPKPPPVMAMEEDNECDKNRQTNKNHTSEDDDSDWQDVTASRSNDHDAEDCPDDVSNTSCIGTLLAKYVIAEIALHEVHVKSPLAAIAVALHAALRSDTLGFSCTGIPDNLQMFLRKNGHGSSSSSYLPSNNGFAPPVRELPKTHFLPQGWDQYASSDGLVMLRYRKHATGAVLLQVSLENQPNDNNGGVVTIRLFPASSSEPPLDGWQVPIQNHINLESFHKALQKSKAHSIPPALHYKALSSLLSNFCQQFDLGPLTTSNTNDTTAIGNDTSTATNTLPYVDMTIQNLPSSRPQRPQVTTTVPPSTAVPPPSFEREPYDPAWNRGQVPTIHTAFPGIRAPHGQHGDFSDDLLPAGIPGPSFGGGNGSMGGNLMGPNHPAFQGPGGGLSGVGPNSGFGMRPRFDPYGPPGGPQDPNTGGVPGINGNPNNPNRRPGGSGNPNPDHMRPPNNLSNNMFL